MEEKKYFVEEKKIFLRKKKIFCEEENKTHHVCREIIMFTCLGKHLGYFPNHLYHRVHHLSLLLNDLCLHPIDTQILDLYLRNTHGNPCE